MLLEPAGHVGGMTSGGLGYTDVADVDVGEVQQRPCDAGAVLLV